MEEEKYITDIRKFEGCSMREISRRTGYHFNTVKKYVNKEDWKVEYLREVRVSIQPKWAIYVVTSYYHTRV